MSHVVKVNSLVSTFEFSKCFGLYIPINMSIGLIHWVVIFMLTQNLLILRLVLKWLLMRVVGLSPIAKLDSLFLETYTLRLSVRISRREIDWLSVSVATTVLCLSLFIGLRYVSRVNTLVLNLVIIVDCSLYLYHWLY